ncbi:unnamed protein product [Calicophoron daubneyi]|uniref:Aquaporin n=1 Tax=Calicophoron daubneyi TaxID=300641 RepID=A0AAV2TEV0_CALDB
MSKYSLANRVLVPPTNEVPRCNAYVARYMVRMFICEMLGVAFVAFPWTVYTAIENFRGNIGNLVAIAYGLWFWTFGPMTGGQIHTGVSLVLLFTRRISYPYAIVAIVAQLVGGIFGCGMAVVITNKYPDSTHHYGMALVPEDSTVWQAFLQEAIALFMIMTLALSTIDESRQGAWARGHVIGFAFAFTMSVMLTAPMIGAYSGVGLNPAINFGAAIVNNYYKHQWVFVVGPIVGCIVAAILYEMVLSNAASSARLRHWFTDPNFDRSLDYKLLDGEVADSDAE